MERKLTFSWGMPVKRKQTPRSPALGGAEEESATGKFRKKSGTLPLSNT